MAVNTGALELKESRELIESRETKASSESKTSQETKAASESNASQESQAAQESKTRSECSDIFDLKALIPTLQKLTPKRAKVFGITLNNNIIFDENHNAYEIFRGKENLIAEPDGTKTRLGRDLKTGKEVWIRIYKPDAPTSQESNTAAPNVVSPHVETHEIQYQNEVEVCKALNYYKGQMLAPKKTSYIILEPGIRRFEQEKSASPAKKSENLANPLIPNLFLYNLDIILGTLRNVKVLHDKHIVHRRFGNSCIMWDSHLKKAHILFLSGAVVLKDDEPYRSHPRHILKSNQIFYKAPELCDIARDYNGNFVNSNISQQPAYTKQSDVYALGALFKHWFDHAYEKADSMILNENMRRVIYWSHILKKIIGSMTHIEPAKRGSIDEAIIAINTLRAQFLADKSIEFENRIPKAKRVDLEDGIFLDPPQAFLMAASNGDLKKVQSLLLEHPKLLNEKDMLGRTALYQAIVNRKEDIAHFLISQENIDIASGYAIIGNVRQAETTPFQQAISKQLVKIACLIVEKKAKCFREDVLRLLYLCIKANFQEWVKYLLNQDPTLIFERTQQLGYPMDEANRLGRVEISRIIHSYVALASHRMSALAQSQRPAPVPMPQSQMSKPISMLQLQQRSTPVPMPQSQRYGQVTSSTTNAVQVQVSSFQVPPSNQQIKDKKLALKAMGMDLKTIPEVVDVMDLVDGPFILSAALRKQLLALKDRFPALEKISRKIAQELGLFDFKYSVVFDDLGNGFILYNQKLGSGGQGETKPAQNLKTAAWVVRKVIPVFHDKYELSMQFYQNCADILQRLGRLKGKMVRKVEKTVVKMGNHKGENKKHDKAYLFDVFQRGHHIFSGPNYQITKSPYFLFTWLNIANSALQALKKLHDLDLIHGDISRRNILWDPDTGCSIVDFDTTRDLQDKDVCAGYNGSVVGTVEYMAPELRARHITHSLSKSHSSYKISNPLFSKFSDIYALGRIFGISLGQIFDDLEEEEGIGMIPSIAVNSIRKAVFLINETLVEPMLEDERSRRPTVERCLELLTSLQKQLGTQHEYGVVRLFAAIRCGDIEIVKNMLLENPDLINSRFQDAQESTPLIIAVKFNHFEILEILLKAKADMNAITAEKYSAIQLACMYQHYRIALKLLDAGADISRKTYDNYTLLHLLIFTYECAREDKEFYELLTRVLQLRPLDINKMNNKWETPLHCAVSMGNVKIVELLSAQIGIDTGFLNNQGKTAFQVAMLNSNDDEDYEIPFHLYDKCIEASPSDKAKIRKWLRDNNRPIPFTLMPPPLLSLTLPPGPGPLRFTVPPKNKSNSPEASQENSSPESWEPVSDSEIWKPVSDTDQKSNAENLESKTNVREIRNP